MVVKKKTIKVETKKVATKKVVKKEAPKKVAAKPIVKAKPEPKKVVVAKKPEVKKVVEKKIEKEIKLNVIKASVSAELPEVKAVIAEVSPSFETKDNVLNDLATGLKGVILESVNRNRPYSMGQLLDAVHVSHKGAEVKFDRKGKDCNITILLHEGNSISFDVPTELVG
ncbi:MAG: hypothetical protein WCI04_06325 [archaeon]